MGLKNSILGNKKKSRNSINKDENNNKNTTNKNTTMNRSTPPPIPPTKPVPSKILLRALYNFEARQNTELSFSVDDILYPLEDIADKTWYKVRHSDRNTEGLIPFNYVVEEDGSPHSMACFYDVKRVEAERLLQIMGNPSGTYLIRTSTEHPNLALSIRVLENDRWEVRHYKINKTNDKWALCNEKSFDTIPQLIKYYQENRSLIPSKLGNALPRNERPVVPFAELEVDRANFFDQTVIGHGNFGDVKKARWGEKGQVYVAIKIVKSNMMSNEQFLEEAKMMHQLRHPRIVELLGISTKPASEPIYIITEFLDKGALLDYLRTSLGRCIEISNLIDILAQIAEGMEYLESKKFIHRDLRAANILVADNNFVKVADFGLARLLDDEMYSATESKFPVRWTAPEASKFNQFSIKSDVWSFGILAYEVVTYGSVPYNNMTTKQVRESIESDEQGTFRLSNPHGQPVEDCIPLKYVVCAQPLYNLMLSCWNQVPERRPTFEHLQNDLSSWGIATEAQYS